MRLCLLALGLAAAFPIATVHAQSVQSFSLKKGQALRILPDGKVDVFSTMQGNAAHVSEMEKRAQPLTKGLGVWFGEDGKLRYIDNPVEGASVFGHP